MKEITFHFSYIYNSIFKISYISSINKTVHYRTDSCFEGTDLEFYHVTMVHTELYF